MDDPRARVLPRFQAENLAYNLETVSHLEKMAVAKECTAAQLAVAWVLSRGNDIVPVVGISNRARLTENLAALDVVFTTKELAELDQVFVPGAIVGDRYPAQVRHLSPR